jgi:hypothetical protein
MNYRIDLTAEAQRDLARLPQDVRRFCLLRLEALAESPTALSRPTRLPFRQKCQLYPFEYDAGLQRWVLHALFQYGQDEQTLYILDIAHSVLDLGDGIDVDIDEPEP